MVALLYISHYILLTYRIIAERNVPESGKDLLVFARVEIVSTCKPAAQLFQLPILLCKLYAAQFQKVQCIWLKAAYIRLHQVYDLVVP